MNNISPYYYYLYDEQQEGMCVGVFQSLKDITDSFGISNAAMYVALHFNEKKVKRYEHRKLLKKRYYLKRYRRTFIDGNRLQT